MVNKISDHPKVGDIVEVSGHRVGQAARTGEIVEILGEPSHVHFRVRWDDETESLFYPSSDATVRQRAGATSKRTKS